MDSYRVLASYYDRFTDDVGYETWADYFEAIFQKEKLAPQFIVDLACGTGAIIEQLGKRGYEMMGVDASAEMLTQATLRTEHLEPRPIYIQQHMEELDLYGTADAFLCCLDSVNYITEPKLLEQAFARVFRFLEPDGIFIFDINTPAKFQRIADTSYVREDEDVYCVWQCLVQDSICTYDFDIFENTGKDRWKRWKETHIEYIYQPEDLRKMLQKTGFTEICCYPDRSFDMVTGQEDRIFFTARKRMETP